MPKSAQTALNTLRAVFVIALFCSLLTLAFVFLSSSTGPLWTLVMMAQGFVTLSLLLMTVLLMTSVRMYDPKAAEEEAS